MIAKLADRVRETTTTTGTGTLSLGGAVVGFRTFVSGIGSGNSCYYAIIGTGEWELGIGTVTSGTPNTLSRSVILSSSNSNSVVDLSAGTKNVFCTAAADAFALSGEAQIASTTLGSDTASFSFTDIPGVFDDLRITGQGRTTATSNQDVLIRFNNDTASNYTRQAFWGVQQTKGAAGSVTQTSISIGGMGSATQNANSFGLFSAHIPDYAGTTFQKGCISEMFDLNTGDGAWEGTTGVVGGRWKNTAAITQIDILLSSGSFKAGSYCTLYGITRS